MIKARIVNESDCADLLTWRNDSQTRKNFFSSDYVKEQDHVNWFKKILASKHSKIIILEFNDQKIGMVRYDSKDFKTYVSINTNPLMRGKGHSSEMLLASEKLIIDIASRFSGASLIFGFFISKSSIIFFKFIFELCRYSFG